MKTSSITIENNKFSCYVAETDKEKQMGLMYVKPPAPIMIFKYNSPEDTKFWMKNTPAPLEILFCLDNKISKIKVGTPYSTELIHGGYSDLVIEVPQGYVSKYGIKINDSVKLGE